MEYTLAKVNTNNNTGSSGLSAGAIAGIVIGSIAVVLIIGGIGWYCCKKKTTKEGQLLSDK